MELYRPELADDRAWACAFVIRGFAKEGVRRFFGVDSMQALVLALHVIPYELQSIARQEGGAFDVNADLGLNHACSVHLGSG